MLLTNDQRFLLDILREVRYMRLDQILPLMRLRDPAKAKSHCEAILRYLRYAGELVPVGDDLVCLAEFRGQVSRNRIRVKERDGKSETGKGRESQSYQGKQRTSMRRPPRRGRALSSSTRTAARGSSGGFLYS